MSSDTLELMVGKENYDIVRINNVETRALIDSGSQISTITEEFLDQLQPKPEIFDLDNLNLDVKVAGGYSLHYKGLISVKTSVPFIQCKGSASGHTYVGSATNGIQPERSCYNWYQCHQQTESSFLGGHRGYRRLKNRIYFRLQ